ncbi:MAG: DSD1 family PLP-dependent enzyme [Thalassobaculales bacterium]
MTQPPPALPGMREDEIDTPALLIDLPAFERNLDRLAGFAARAGVRLRPHAKTHKSPDVALRQMARGAVGVCCQKVSEAEAMVAGGVPDVLVSNEVWGGRKLARLAALAGRARIGVCVDDAAQVGPLSAAAVAAGTSIGVLVEIEVGAGRCGVAPGEAAAALGRLVAAAPGLRFEGLQAYHGRAQHLRQPAERKAAIAAAAEAVGASVAALKAAGLACATIGGAGTGTFAEEAASGLWNELQCGSYCFMDADYALNQSPDIAFEHALFVLATVMSRPTAERAVLDAGHKAVSIDAGLPLVWERPEATVAGLADEHCRLLTGASNDPLALGSRVRLVPGHCDPTVNLHDWYVGVRDGVVECVWPVAARGALA